MHKYFLFIVILLSSIAAFSDIESRIIKAEKDYLSHRFLNAVFMFADEKKPILVGAKGVFSLDNGEQLKANELMPIAGGTKPMTAAGILKLQDLGLLNINDKIVKYLDKDLWQDKIPLWAYRISIHNLLTHTSGLPEYFSNVKLDLGMSEEDINKSVIRFISTKSLEHKVGRRYRYSNTNFILLGMIIEKVSGKSLSDFLSTEFFTPLDMKSTKLVSFKEAFRIQKNVVSSNYPIRYFVAPTGNKPHFSPADTSSTIMSCADRGIVSTTADLIKWYRALRKDNIFRIL